ncbi:Metallo-dependent hydrolase [Cyathus striatus]|nr:Metallo-dependent hydrolase [Cyathus striatus]
MVSASILLQNGLLATFTDKDAPTSIPKAYRADILIEGDTITSVVAKPESIEVTKDALVIDCTNKWIAPGFIDTHRHVWMSIVSGHEDWTLTEYLAKQAWTTASFVNADDVYVGQLAGCLQALHGGTTTVLDHFHCANSASHIDNAIQATVESGIRSMFCLAQGSPPTSIDPIQFANGTEITQMQEARLQSLASANSGKLTPDGRVTLGLAYDALGINPSKDKRIIGLARSLNIKPITFHDVGGPQTAGPMFKNKITQWKEVGLLGGDIVVSHANSLLHPERNEKEWDWMREVGAGIASTPEDELGMGHGQPVLFEAIRRDVNAGLGIDCTSVVSSDMFPAMRVALANERGRIHKALAPVAPKTAPYHSATVFRAATLGGALATQTSDILGTIEHGKRADIVIYDALGIVYHATAADVEWVFVNGEAVKKEGKLIRKQWDDVVGEFRARMDGIRKKVAELDLEERYTILQKGMGWNVTEEYDGCRNK